MDHPLYYGKNIEAFNPHPPAPPHKNKFERDWDGPGIVRSGLIEMITNQWDAKFTLRALNEKLAELVNIR
jgi:hypothetical protein